MDFHGLNDDQIFERVADEPAFARFEALIHMGMHRNFERIDEAIGFYRSAFELAKAEGLTEQSFIAVRFWVNALRLADRQAEAVALLEAELNDEEVAKVSDDEIGRAKLEYALVLAEQDKVDEAIKMLESAEPFFTGNDAECAMAEFHNRVSDAFYSKMRFQLAANMAQRARTYSTNCGHTDVTGRALYMVARAYEQMHMFDEALACYKESDALMSECDFGDFELWCRLAKARILWLRKDYDGSLKPLYELQEFSDGLPYADPELKPRIALQMARAYLARGGAELAATQYYKARTLLRAMRQNPWAAVAEGEGALAQLALGNADEAVAAADTAIRWLTEKPSDFADFWVRLAYGQVMNATGNHSAALAVLKEHSKTDLTTDFEPNVQFRLELAVAQSACDEDDEAADTAGVLVEFFDHHLDFDARGRLYSVLTQSAVKRNDLPEALRCIALAIKNYAGNPFKVDQLTDWLNEIATSQTAA